MLNWFLKNLVNAFIVSIVDWLKSQDTKRKALKNAILEATNKTQKKEINSFKIMRNIGDRNKSGELFNDDGHRID